MHSHRFIALPLAMVASLALTAGALAGGWATVAMTEPPSEPTAGVGTTFDLNVLQHGVTPVSWPVITVIATDASSGATVAGQAEASGAVGHYSVSLTFPTEGSWTISYASKDLVMQGSQELAVAAPAVLAASSSAPVATSPVVDGAMAAALFILVVGFLGAFCVIVVRDRRTDRSSLRSATPSRPPVTD